MSRYLVSGGAGFIGSHLVEELARRGARVRVVDNLSTGHRHNLPSSVDLIEGDLVDPDVARAAVRDMTVVLHQAAIPSVPRSIRDPVTSHRANVDATFNLLLASRDAGVRRFVYAGSSSAYGNTAVLPKREDMTASPRSPYALQKLMGEEYARLFAELYGLETVTLRYFNVFGPRQDPSSPYSGVISLFTTALLEGRAPTIHGDGEQTRDFTYVVNVVDGVLRAAHAPDVAGQVINVATGGRISLNALYETLARIIGSTAPPPVHTDPRSGDVRDSQADITRARTLLGYTPLVDLEEGLRRTVAWYRESATTGARPSEQPS